MARERRTIFSGVGHSIDVEFDVGKGLSVLQKLEIVQFLHAKDETPINVLVAEFETRQVLRRQLIRPFAQAIKRLIKGPGQLDKRSL